METLSNSILTVQIAEHGAELQSIKKDGKEYLWQGDAKFWGRRSPVLFPIVDVCGTINTVMPETLMK